MRGPLLAPALLASVSLLVGACASAPPPSPVAISIEAPALAPGTDPISPADRLLALVTEGNPRLDQVARSLAIVGDRVALRVAGRRLVGFARAVGSAAWEEAERVRAQEEGEAAPSMAGRADAALKMLLAAMDHVGGPDVVAFCFALAEDEAAPLDRRRLALGVLDRFVEEGDAAAVARRAGVAARLPAAVAAVGDVRARQIVAHLQRTFRACYLRALEEDPALEVKLRVATTVAPDGKVTRRLEGDRLPPELARCLNEAMKRADAVGERGPVVTMPFWFTRGR